MESKKIIILGIFLVLSILPFISADIIMQEVDKTSGIIINGSLDVELRNATVEINLEKGYLKAVFDVYSNEDEIVYSKVYLKAMGQDCYRDSCHDVDVADISTIFRIRNTEPIIINYPGGSMSEINLYDFDEPTVIYETKEGKFASSETFILAPKQVMKIYVEQEITAPFEYYLDSLSTFTKADHEKITIYGNVTAEFNKKYPVKKISENEFVWEYSNLDTTDLNLKDKLVITSNNHPNPGSNNTYLIIGAVAIVLIVIGILIKKRK